MQMGYKTGAERLQSRSFVLQNHVMIDEPIMRGYPSKRKKERTTHR